MKDFSKWMKLKGQLDEMSHTAPFVSEGDMWWASIGENVGSEIGGKNDLFSRPVIIQKKLAHGFYFVIPTSSKTKDMIASSQHNRPQTIVFKTRHH